MEVSTELPGYEAEERLSTSATLGQAKNWSDILTRRFVVVLGEAGTGKTTEFRRQAGITSGGRDFTFFVEMAELAEVGLTESVDPAVEKELTEWRQGDGEGTFFIDSLDEAKLRNWTLARALRKLRRCLSSEWSRVRLVVSCRPSDWMPRTDLKALQEVANDESQVLVVQISPLTRPQVRELAVLAGIAEPAAFMRSIEDNCADVFVTRPIDVTWLAGYWSRHQRLDSLSELINDNVREKLKGATGRHCELPPDRLLAGVRTLAGVATITNCWAFRLRDQSMEVRRTTDAIEPQDMLPDWSDSEVEQLLTRPIFDEATYGRVRFHHRSVQEYLAAQWLHDLLSSGLALEALIKLLLPRVEKRQVVPEHLEPVAAWLCLRSHDFFDKVATAVPTVLLRHGDPAALTPASRTRVLSAFTSRYDDRKRLFEWFDQDALRRLASPTLTAEVKRLLVHPGTPDELIGILLQLVGEGRLHGCGGVSADIALDEKRPGDVRYYALRALTKLGPGPELARVVEQIRSIGTWTPDIADSLVRTLYPDWLNVEDLLAIVRSLASSPHQKTRSLRTTLKHTVSGAGSLEQRLSVLGGLVELICVEGPGNQLRVHESMQWLLPCVAGLLSKLLGELGDFHEPPEPVRAALEIFRWCGQMRMNIWHGLSDVEKAVTRHPPVRRFLFWQRVAAHQKEHGSTPTKFFNLKHGYTLFEVSEVDRTWLAKDAISRTTVQERLLAFDAIYRHPSAPDREHVKCLERLAEKSPELGRRWARIVRPPPPGPEARNFGLEKKARALEASRRQEQKRRWLLNSITSIRDGTAADCLESLYQSAQDSRCAYGIIASDRLLDSFGAEIAEAALAGWRACWRRYNPKLPHEREKRSSIPWGLSCGLVGLGSELTSQTAATSLTFDDAELATRYAACEMNSFPSWLTWVFEAHGPAVVRVLRPALVAEMNIPEAGETLNDVLAKVSRSEGPLRLACREIVTGLLLKKDPPALDALGQALGTIGEWQEETHKLELLAAERCDLALKGPERFSLWWCNWLTQVPSSALEYIETLERSHAAETVGPIVVGVGHRLFELDRFEKDGLPDSVRSVAVASRLFRLLYEHVNPANDPDHGGVYTPGPRDHAQMTRSRVLNWLTESSDPAAVASLQTLADDPRLRDIRDHLLHSADHAIASNAAVSDDAKRTAATLTELCRKHGSRLKGASYGETTQGSVVSGTGGVPSAMPASLTARRTPTTTELPPTCDRAAMSEGDAPNIFISYAHDDEAHKAWVAELARDLRAANFNVSYDGSDLRLGDDLARFMENGIQATHILLVLTPNYCTKANNRIGGVGYESSLLTGELLQDPKSARLIGILRSGDRKASVPAYMKSKLHLDMREDSKRPQRLAELISSIRRTSKALR